MCVELPGDLEAHRQITPDVIFLSPALHSLDPSVLRRSRLRPAQQTGVIVLDVTWLQ